jgi:hypothetical protein
VRVLQRTKPSPVAFRIWAGVRGLELRFVGADVGAERLELTRI